MARYTGPRAKRARRLGVALVHLTAKDADKDPTMRKPYPPGQHGPTARYKPTEYGIRLMEKQKLQLAYELLEHQCRRYVGRSKHSGGNAAVMLPRIIESRFDVLVWRAGFATSMRQARQFVRHGYFTVNGKKANLPSMELKAGSKVEFRARFVAHALIESTLSRMENRSVAPHVRIVEKGKSFEVVGAAEDCPTPIPIDLVKVVEFYS